MRCCCLSRMRLSIHPPIHRSVHRSISLSHLPAYVPIYLSMHLSLPLSIVLNEQLSFAEVEDLAIRDVCNESGVEAFCSKKLCQHQAQIGDVPPLLSKEIGNDVISNGDRFSDDCSFKTVSFHRSRHFLHPFRYDYDTSISISVAMILCSTVWYSLATVSY